MRISQILRDSRSQGLGLYVCVCALVCALVCSSCVQQLQHTAAGNPSYHLANICTMTPKGKTYPQRRAQGGAGG